MHVSRLYRVLRLITMLQSGRSLTVDELSRELEVSRRTVFRDLNVLELAHIPYYYDRSNATYRIDNHFFLPPVNLTLNEALALLLASTRAQVSGFSPLASAAGRAGVKLESVLPPPVREYLGTVMEKIRLQPAPPARQAGLDDVFDRLVSTVGEHRLCRIVYLSFLERKQMTLTLEPRRLVFVSRAWYLVAWSRHHKQQRTFKLARIRKLTVLDEAFPPPPAEEGAAFGQAWSMIPEGRLYDVHLRFVEQVAGNVAEVRWHDSQQVEWRDDGSIDFRVRVDGLGEIAWWILGYGDRVKVLQPPELASRVAQTARGVAAQYEGGG